MKKLNFKKHMMTGISYMIPMIVAGGILGALAKGFGGWEVGNYAPEAGATIFTNLNCFDWKQFWWMISKLSDYAMSFGVAVMTAGVCYSIAERPGIVPGSTDFCARTLNSLACSLVKCPCEFTLSRFAR